MARSGSSAGDLRALEAMLGGVDESVVESLEWGRGRILRMGERQMVGGSKSEERRLTGSAEASPNSNSA
jgi:hypothetical protein